MPYDLFPHLRNKRYEHNTLGPQALHQVSLVQAPESCLINGAYCGSITGGLATDDRFVRWKHASDFSVTWRLVTYNDNYPREDSPRVATSARLFHGSKCLAIMLPKAAITLPTE